LQEIQFINGPIQPTPEQAKRITRAMSHSMWKLIPLHWQDFCKAYIIFDGDKLKAVEATYKSATKKAALVKARKFLHDQRVRDILNLTALEEKAKPVTKKELGQLISDRLRNDRTNSVVFLKMVQLYMEMNKWDALPTPHQVAYKQREDAVSESIEDQVLALEAQQRNNNGS